MVSGVEMVGPSAPALFIVGTCEDADVGAMKERCGRLGGFISVTDDSFQTADKGHS